MNRLPATITDITSSTHTILITADCVDAQIDIIALKPFDIAVDEGVFLAFKSSEVALSKDKTDTTANAIKATVIEIKKSAILTNIRLSFGNFTIDSLILSKKSHNFSINDELYCHIQPSEITIIKDEDGV